MKAFLTIVMLAISASVIGPQSVPPGTILPVRLNTSLSSSKTKPGAQINARVMQSVPLPDGGVIHEGAKLVGQVIRVSGPVADRGAEIAFQFDTIKIPRSSIPLTADLRAMASFMELQDAQDPSMGADRGTMPAAYTTVQVGGDVVYRGGGPVMHGGEVVGEPVPGGVLVRLRENAEAGCHGAEDGSDRPQALWLFASDACGAYGLSLLIIAHKGRSEPVGVIVVTAREGELRVPSGTGMLLRVFRQGS
jgi:hypothetical protein